MKHTAKKIEAGSYEYRGYEIRITEDTDWGQDGWLIIAPDETSDKTNTLKEAKALIDYTFKFAEKWGAL
jgi:hypothetical protein